MKITRVNHHGKTRWRVNDPHGPNGKRQRKFFETQADAERWAKQRTEDRKAFGIHFAEMPASERAALAYHMQRLKDAGWTLAAAVDYVLTHGRNPPSVSLGRIVDDFLASKKTGGLRPYYVTKLGASVRRFAKGREAQPIAEITAKEIQEYISCNGWKPATMRSYLVDVKTLFAFAVKRKFLRENTADAVDLPRTDDKPPGIVTPDQASAVLNGCLDKEPDALAVVALCLFGGLRRAEAEKLEWEEIGAEFIEVKSHKAKTRRRRLVPVSAQLRAWLDCAKSVKAQLPAVNYAGKLTRVLDKAGLREDWPQNGLRHSFASYHFAKHRRENDTASIMGNSPQMVFQHYRELVRPSDADAFFALLPPSDAVARAETVRASRRRKGRKLPPRIPSKLTPERVAAVFDGGRVPATLRDAALTLMAATGCSQGAAYLALSLRGRFAAHLRRDADGRLWWNSSPKPPPGPPQPSASADPGMPPQIVERCLPEQAPESSPDTSERVAMLSAKD